MARKFGKKNHVKVDPFNYSLMLLGEPKIGKEQPVSEPVLTENGWVKMGDIAVGTKIFGEDGCLYNVTGIYPQGVKDVYKVTFRDGTSTRCGLEHLWTVQTTKQRANSRDNSDYRYKVLTLKEILKDYKTFRIEPEKINGGNFKYKYSIPINKPVNFKEQNHIISPMALGMLLGDGGFTQNVITFTNSEDELFDILSKELSNLNIELHTRTFNNHKQATLTCNGVKPNPLKEELKRLGLYECGSREKFIPKEYMYDSIENRINLLSGIVNTDGNMSGGLRIGVSTYSKYLASDIAELARSLGFIVTIKEYDRTSDDSTKKYDKEIEYHLSIIGDDYSMLKLSTKHKNALNVGKNISYVKTIHNIEYVGKEESQCIMVDNPNHLYITNDYIVTHNTTLLYQVAEKLVGENGYIFAELFRERGADAIEGIVAENIPTWDDWEEFVDDIVDNKTEDYPDLKVIFMDTYDGYINMAISRAIELWNKKNPEKRAESLNQSWNGFDSGKKVIDLMFEQTDRLESVGVKVWWIGHVKTKDVKNLYGDETYQTLTSDQQQNYFNALKKNLHFLCLAYFDRELQKEKTGRKNIVTKKEEIKTTIKDETRKIKFRDDSFVVDSGSRFADIKETINLDADEFIEAITDAIKAEIGKNGGSVEDRKKENAKEETEKLKRIAEAEAKAKIQKELDSIKSEIVAFFVENKANVEAIKLPLAICKENGFGNPNEITDLNVAKEVLKACE